MASEVALALQKCSLEFETEQFVELQRSYQTAMKIRLVRQMMKRRRLPAQVLQPPRKKSYS